MRVGWGSPMATVTPPRRVDRKATSRTAGTPAASKVTSAPPWVRSFTAFSASSGGMAAVAPSWSASSRLAGTGSTAMIGQALAHGPDHRGEPHPRQAEDGHRLPGADRRRVEHRSGPGQHRASEEGRGLDGDVRGASTADSRATTA